MSRMSVAALLAGAAVWLAGSTAQAQVIVRVGGYAPVYQPVYAAPVYAAPVYAAPVYQPYYAAPVYQPAYVAPVYPAYYGGTYVRAPGVRVAVGPFGGVRVRVGGPFGGVGVFVR